METDTPEITRGWLKKQSRTGLIKNWKSRFVVLDQGTLYYYEKKISKNIAPYGDNLKGMMNLKGANVMNNNTESGGSNRIYIVGDFVTETDLLLEADNSKVFKSHKCVLEVTNRIFQESKIWSLAFQQHIAFANASDMVSTLMTKSGRAR